MPGEIWLHAEVCSTLTCEEVEVLHSPEVANLGSRLWLSWMLLLQVTVGSDREWPMLVGACRRVFGREGTFTLGCEGSGWEEGVSGSSSDEPAVIQSGLDSDLGMWRPLARVMESGRGKVPIPLSRVLIWQLESKVTGRGVWRSGKAGKNNNRRRRKEFCAFTCNGRGCE